MEMLSGKQRKQLRGLAHDLKPVVLIGQNGVNDSAIRTIEKALLDHELIKVKFNDYKEDRKALSQEIAEKLSANLVGEIGNIAIFYKEHPEEEKRKVRVS